VAIVGGDGSRCDDDGAAAGAGDDGAGHEVTHWTSSEVKRMAPVPVIGSVIVGVMSVAVAVEAGRSGRRRMRKVA
jgi:hypothetical protein